MTEQSQDNGQFVSKSTPIIKVIGCGNCGAKLIDIMLEKGIDRVEFSVLDTDKGFLENISCQKKSLIGRNIANGQGAGGLTDIGKAAAEEDALLITELVKNANLTIVLAGMGGGTGTGAAPVVADIAKKQGCKTLAFVTIPFNFEGSVKKEQAEEGIKELQKKIDGIATISLQKFLETNRNMSFDNVDNHIADAISQSIKKIADYITSKGNENITIAELISLM